MFPNLDISVLKILRIGRRTTLLAITIRSNGCVNQQHISELLHIDPFNRLWPNNLPSSTEKEATSLSFRRSDKISINSSIISSFGENQLNSFSRTYRHRKIKTSVIQCYDKFGKSQSGYFKMWTFSPQ